MVAGLHRLEANKLLGMTNILCTVLGRDEDLRDGGPAPRHQPLEHLDALLRGDAELGATRVRRAEQRAPERLDRKSVV